MARKNGFNEIYAQVTETYLINFIILIDMECTNWSIEVSLEIHWEYTDRNIPEANTYKSYTYKIIIVASGN